MRAAVAVGRCENFLHSSGLPDRGSSVGQRRGRSLPESHPPVLGQAGEVTRSRMATCAQLRKRRRGFAATTKAEALDLQTTVNGILAQALGERSRIGGAVNWADLRCVDVEISLLDDVVTVTIAEAAPGTVEL